MKTAEIHPHPAGVSPHTLCLISDSLPVPDAPVELVGRLIRNSRAQTSLDRVARRHESLIRAGHRLEAPDTIDDPSQQRHCDHSLFDRLMIHGRRHPTRTELTPSGDRPLQRPDRWSQAQHGPRPWSRAPSGSTDALRLSTLALRSRLEPQPRGRRLEGGPVPRRPLHRPRPRLR
jgi:hypothetical protein